VRQASSRPCVARHVEHDHLSGHRISEEIGHAAGDLGMLVAREPPGFADWSLMQNDEPISMAGESCLEARGKGASTGWQHKK
jgi:hypothetical protein